VLFPVTFAIHSASPDPGPTLCGILQVMFTMFQGNNFPSKLLITPGVYMEKFLSAPFFNAESDIIFKFTSNYHLKLNTYTSEYRFPRKLISMSTLYTQHLNVAVKRVKNIRFEMRIYINRF